MTQQEMTALAVLWSGGSYADASKEANLPTERVVQLWHSKNGKDAPLREDAARAYPSRVE